MTTAASPSPEFRLVCVCCHWPRSDAALDRIREAADGPVDWQRVLGLGSRHRVYGLLAQGLRAAGVTVPEPQASMLAQAQGDVVRANLAAAAEYQRIANAFGGAGIDLLFFKGLPLAQQVYGTIALKSSRDIDVLVAPEAVAQAGGILAGFGYTRLDPGPEIPDDRLAEWMRWRKEIGWAHRRRRTIVEVHDRLSDNPTSTQGIGLGSRRETVTIASGVAVETLAREPLYAYLCLHGAGAGWARLKWLADLGALLGALSHDEIARLHADAEGLGLGRCSAQGLLLCAELLDTDIGAELRARLVRAPIHRLLVRLAHSAIIGRDELAEFRHDSIRGVPVLVSQFLIRKGLRHKRAELRIKLANPHDRALRRLPERLSAFYPMLSVQRFAVKRATALFGGGTHRGRRREETAQ